MFQQTQVVQHQDCQEIRVNFNSQNLNMIQDEGTLASIIDNLQISQPDVQNLSLLFKSSTMADLKLFLELFYKMIKNQKQQEGENEQYIYMKHNLIRILTQSLRLYWKKGGSIDFDEWIDDILKEDSDIYFSEEEQLLIFKDPKVCEQLQEYISKEFDNNRPEGNYDNLFFKLCFGDYCHYKQRMIDKEPWQRQDITNFNKIYRWDIVYTKIIELIFYSNHLSALNLQDKNKVQQSSFILQHGLVEMKEQIQQKQDLNLILYDLEFQKLRVQEIEQKYNDLLEQQQIQYQKWSTKNQQLKLINYQDNDKVQLTPELMGKKNRFQVILGQLILKDVQEQKNSVKNLQKDLNHICSKQQQGQDCDKKDIIDLYKKPEGRIYLKKYITGKNIDQFISGEQKQISQILNDMSVFKVQLDRELKNRK